MKLVTRTKPLAELLPGLGRSPAASQTLLFNLGSSIDEFGEFGHPIWNRRTGNVVDGRKRLRLLWDRGVREITVYVIDRSAGAEAALRAELHIHGKLPQDELEGLLAKAQREEPALYDALAFAQLELDLMLDGAGLVPPDERPGQLGLWGE